MFVTSTCEGCCEDVSRLSLNEAVQFKLHTQVLKLASGPSRGWLVVTCPGGHAVSIQRAPCARALRVAGSITL